MVSSPDYVARMLGLEREMIIHRVPDQLRKLLVTVMLLSWGKGRDAAPVEDQLTLAQAAHMDTGDCSRAFAEARKMGILREVRLGGRFWLELLPDSALWVERSTTKVDGERVTKKKSKRAPSAEEIALSRSAWARLEAEGDPAQQGLAMEIPLSHPPLADGGLGDAMAEANRENADGKLKLGISQLKAQADIPGPAKLGNSQLPGQNPNPPKLGNSQFTHAGAGARKHDHEPCTPSVPQSMVHDDHGRRGAEEEDRFAGMDRHDLEPLLEAEAAYWYDQLPEIFGAEDAEAFRLTWLKRLCDRWNNCAYRAIGEVKRMKISGQDFKKGPGQYANFFFNKYRYATWKSARNKEEKASQS